jgi:hypothetical protein
MPRMTFEFLSPVASPAAGPPIYSRAISKKIGSYRRAFPYGGSLLAGEVAVNRRAAIRPGDISGNPRLQLGKLSPRV